MKVCVPNPYLSSRTFSDLVSHCTQNSSLGQCQLLSTTFSLMSGNVKIKLKTLIDK